MTATSPELPSDSDGRKPRGMTAPPVTESPFSYEGGTDFEEGEQSQPFETPTFGDDRPGRTFTNPPAPDRRWRRTFETEPVPCTGERD